MMFVIVPGVRMREFQAGGGRWARAGAVLAVLGGLAGLGGAAQAQETPDPPVRWEGALGPVANISPEYSGGAHEKMSVVPGFFLRYGRYTVSNTGAFVTRRSDDVFRGLGADLHLTDTVRTNLALRIDNGRDSARIDGLQGMDDIRRTLRGQLSATWRPGNDHPMAGWHATAAVNADLLDRGVGQTFSLLLARDLRWNPSLTWSYGGTLSAGSGQYLRAWYGVTPEESARTGHPVYRPGLGLSDFTLSIGWRLEIEDKWVAFWGGSAGRLLGPAAASPLTERPGHWSLDGGIARRF